MPVEQNCLSFNTSTKYMLLVLASWFRSCGYADLSLHTILHKTLAYWLAFYVEWYSISVCQYDDTVYQYSISVWWYSISVALTLLIYCIINRTMYIGITLWIMVVLCPIDYTMALWTIIPCMDCLFSNCIWKCKRRRLSVIYDCVDSIAGEKAI